MKTIIISVSVLVLILYSCSQKLPVVPPINKTATSEKHPGKFIWRDLMCRDIPAVKKFYSELFGWTYMDVEKSDIEYTIAMHDNKPVAGIFKLKKLKENQNYSQWISYLSVDDINKSVNYFKGNRGSIYKEPIEVHERGIVSFVFDSQHAVLALLKSSSGDTKDNGAVYNEWLWTELWTNDVENSVNFYKGLSGYNQRKFVTKAGSNYDVLEKEGKPRAGIVKIPFKNVRPNWLPYIAVEDPSEIVNKVEQLGGKVYLSDQGVAGNNAAVIADPSGAVFAVQKWPLEKGEFMEVK